MGNRYSTGQILAAITIIALAVGLFFFSPLATMLLWNWFVAPATGFATLGYWLAMGIDFAIGFIFNGARLLSDKENKITSSGLAGAASALVSAYLTIGLVIGIGALITLML